MKIMFDMQVTAANNRSRRFYIEGSASLHDLHRAILTEFKKSDNHLHAFFMNNCVWDPTAEYVSPFAEMDNVAGFTDKTALSIFPLRKGSEFLYIFDFGKEQRFQVKVMEVLDEETNEPIKFRVLG